MVKIILNGKEKDINASTNLQSLISQLCQDPNRVIVELNGHVIKNLQWTKTAIKDGDKLELVNFVGGG